MNNGAKWWEAALGFLILWWLVRGMWRLLNPRPDDSRAEPAPAAPPLVAPVVAPTEAQPIAAEQARAAQEAQEAQDPEAARLARVARLGRWARIPWMLRQRASYFPWSQDAIVEYYERGELLDRVIALERGVEAGDDYGSYESLNSRHGPPFRGRRTRSDHNGDATRGHGHTYRENGRYGSHPLHDDYGSEGEP